MTQTSVLVVDDHPDIRQALHRLLNQAGYAVTEAANGIEALDFIRSDPPDVAILDVMMPGMGGLDVLSVMRQDPLSARIPVLLYSAMDDEAIRQEGSRLGASEYLVKGRAGIDEILLAICRASSAVSA